MKTRKRHVQVGDVFELRLKAGVAHVQAIGQHPRFRSWSVVRVLRQTYPNSIDDADSIARGLSDYTVIMGNIASCERAGRLRYIGQAAIPAPYDNWKPIIRVNSTFLSDGRRRPDQWWLDDGTEEKRIGKLSFEQQSLTDSEFVPALALTGLIDRGWDPNWEFKGPDAKQFKFASEKVVEEAARVGAFFMIFPSLESAQTAKAEASAQGISSDDQIDELSSDDEKSPQFMLVCEVPEERLTDADAILGFEELFASLAQKHGGVYDGNEISI